MRQVVVYRDLEDGGWVAEMPSLPGCVSQGESKAEALRNITDASHAWIEAAKESGQAIPNDPQDAEIVMVEAEK